jgi:hypothetical protein
MSAGPWSAWCRSMVRPERRSGESVGGPFRQPPFHIPVSGLYRRYRNSLRSGQLSSSASTRPSIARTKPWWRRTCNVPQTGGALERQN